MKTFKFKFQSKSHDNGIFNIIVRRIPAKNEQSAWVKALSLCEDGTYIILSCEVQ